MTQRERNLVRARCILSHASGLSLQVHVAGWTPASELVAAGPHDRLARLRPSNGCREVRRHRHAERRRQGRGARRRRARADRRPRAAPLLRHGPVRGGVARCLECAPTALTGCSYPAHTAYSSIAARRRRSRYSTKCSAVAARGRVVRLDTHPRQFQVRKASSRLGVSTFSWHGFRHRMPLPQFCNLCGEPEIAGKCTDSTMSMRHHSPLPDATLGWPASRAPLWGLLQTRHRRLRALVRSMQRRCKARTWTPLGG